MARKERVNGPSLINNFFVGALVTLFVIAVQQQWIDLSDWIDVAISVLEGVKPYAP